MNGSRDIENGTQPFRAFRLSNGGANLSKTIIFILLGLMCFVAFKNISYPLLWNDEAETAMGAQRVINYGYPKIHNGTNSIFVPDNPMWLGCNDSLDVLNGGPWGNFFFGTIGVKLAEYTSDIYQKTALIRLPFAAAALLGLIIFAFSFRGFFASATSFRIFFACFLLFEMLSVNLLLHIRQARYYSVIILLSACFFYVFSAFHFHMKLTKAKYLIALVIILLAAFWVGYLPYSALFVMMCSYQCLAYISYRLGWPRFVKPYNFRESVVLLSPLFLVTLLILPALVFYQFFSNVKGANVYYHNGVSAFINHLHGVLAVLCKFDLLPAMILVKICSAVYAFVVGRKNLAVSHRTQMLESMAFFMLLFMLVFASLVCRMPWVFTRYFIVLQPIVILMLLADLMLILDYESLLPPINLSGALRFTFLPIAFIICLSDIALSENHFSDYIYQLSHPLKGPLDYYIPAIKEKFPHTENIVLATNYEEFSYEYYLGCNVIIGYGNKFRPISEKELQQYSPDVMIIRPFWKQSLMPYQYYLQHGNYQKVVFPVADRPVNDLPEMNFFMVHQFKTHIAETDDKKAYMYLKAQP